MTQFITSEALHKKTSQEITALLYEACVTNLESAIKTIDEKDYIQANENLKKATDILHRLGAGINYEAGIVADQLDTLYNYMADKLVEANYNKDVTSINEVLNILTEIMNAWNLAMKKNADAQPKIIRQKANAYEQTAIYE
ncbi:flagellar export chaperone FliS [Bacillus sp. FJAT-45350]|uniref:flagellar export chaperone FliS n=1 Tax=Bacillus sp. FJAT-45350 TaxID=2011014 RepID=UPI000BB79442|nr:flagellar export chaperone FliS [Bacillus sp. FJAT-45350]